jgi:hypothetical protein
MPLSRGSLCHSKGKRLGTPARKDVAERLAFFSRGKARLPRRPESPLFGVDPNTVGFSLLRRMEEIAAIAQVIGTIKKPPTSRKNRFEGPVYLIKAKIYLPPNKYLNDLFRVSVCEPIDLAKGPPAVMEHGIFTFDSCQKLKVGKLLGIIVSPA